MGLYVPSGAVGISSAAKSITAAAKHATTRFMGASSSFYASIELQRGLPKRFIEEPCYWPKQSPPGRRQYTRDEGGRPLSKVRACLRLRVLPIEWDRQGCARP